jgi:hypothetical protein
MVPNGVGMVMWAPGKGVKLKGLKPKRGNSNVWVKKLSPIG